VWWFISMERCCQAQFLVESIARPLLVDAVQARFTRAVNGTPVAGWFNYQTPVGHDRQGTARPAELADYRRRH
jgi:hypothetical protein